jgi:chondroitin AC lyase
MKLIAARMLNTVWWAAFFLLITFAGRGWGAEGNRDMKAIKEKIIRPLLEKKVVAVKVKQILKASNSDGSFKGINYKDKTRSGWKPPQHLSKLTVLVLAYKNPKSPFFNSPKFKKNVFASLDYWLKHDYQNSNWWWNVIGVPRKLGPLLLILDDQLSAAQRKKGVEILKRGKLSMDGQNLVWVAEVTINRGILTGNPDLVDKAFKRIAGEIKLSGKQGIQQDFSFHQHGNCLYNHGYGSGFAVDCSRLAGLAANTRFAFAREKTNILTSYVLDGSQWMVYGSSTDFGAEGREITRAGQNSKYLLRAANNLLKLPTGREKELQALASRIADRSAAALEGNRHFWRSDLMTHLRKSFYASARMYSTRMDNTDYLSNGEGLKSHYIADGCNYLFVSGDEYKDIFPVWDWQKIPGTTVEQIGKFKGRPRRNGTRAFVGGVSDGQYGFAAMDLERNGLVAHKAWFFFDKEYVCLGAAITCPSANQVLTTVNQCHLRGEVSAFGHAGNKRLAKRQHKLKGPINVYHNKVGYFFNAGLSILLRNAVQVGSWNAISKSLSRDNISRDVFSLCIDHGAKPLNSTYSYVVVPGVSEKQARAYAEKPQVEVLNNTVDIQAVTNHNLKLSQIVFYKPGKLKIDKMITVKVNKACLLMIQKNGNELRMSLADPTQKLKVINIEVSGRWQVGQGTDFKFDSGKNISTFSLNLPQGANRGQSVSRNLKKAK